MERALLLLSILFLKLFAQDEFIFWAELNTKNHILFHQKENLSPAMTKSEDFTQEYVCDIAYEDEDLKYLQKTELGLFDDDMPKELKLRFLTSHKGELMYCFSSVDVKVRDFVQNSFMKASTSTYVKFLPLRFSVIFSQDKAVIYLLKKD